MSDFTLYYWPVPFRGEFVRALLAHAGATVDEPGSDAVSAMMEMDPRDQPGSCSSGIQPYNAALPFGASIRKQSFLHGFIPPQVKHILIAYHRACHHFGLGGNLRFCL